ncbi:MAG: hypothetical protein L0Y56_06070 [Nitrospira sp.]|nr:hypothetical protein [Nitrospira sp.]
MSGIRILIGIAVVCALGEACSQVSQALGATKGEMVVSVFAIGCVAGALYGGGLALYDFYRDYGRK